MVEFLPGASAALIESITGKAHNMEGIHDRGCAEEFFDSGALETSESIHHDNINALRPSIGLKGQTGFEDDIGAAWNYVQEPGEGTAVTDECQTQDNGDDSCPRKGCDATHVHPRR